ncbi:MAG: HdeD family acid-resistance protein [Hyphomicrobiales bacterium]|nr:HdeD family acid-resistance protein [Hyphomicrobiales bacterium]
MTPVELPRAASPFSAPIGLGSSLAHLRARWANFAALGAAFILCGTIALGSLVSATVASVWMNGLMMILAGIAEIGMGLHMKDWGRLVLLSAAGVLIGIAGVICVINPLLAAVALTLCLGAGLCATGLVRIYVASQMGSDAPWRVAVLSGLFTFILGVIILASWPVNSRYVLGLFLAIDLIFYGLAHLGLAFQLRAGQRVEP